MSKNCLFKCLKFSWHSEPAHRPLPDTWLRVMLTSVPRTLTICSVETTHGSTCIAMCHEEFVRYRALVAIVPAQQRLTTEDTLCQSILHGYYKFLMKPEDCTSSPPDPSSRVGPGNTATLTYTRAWEHCDINLHKSLTTLQH